MGCGASSAVAVEAKETVKDVPEQIVQDKMPPPGPSFAGNEENGKNQISSTSEQRKQDSSWEKSSSTALQIDEKLILAEQPAKPMHTKRKQLTSQDSFSKRSSMATGPYLKILQEKFPGAIPEEFFIQQATELLEHHGFTPATAINLVSTCRDEICRPFTQELDRIWGPSFSISSLAGMVFCGRTGFKAAMAHSPVEAGRERYVFWVMPHIGLSSDGHFGKVYRVGREHPSSACGALLAVLKEIQNSKLNLEVDQHDLEQSYLKLRVVSRLRYGHIPDLVELTYAAYECILDEVKSTCDSSVDPLNSDYVIIAGVQVNGPMGNNFFWPGAMTKFSHGSPPEDLLPDLGGSLRWRPATPACHGKNAEQELMIDSSLQHYAQQMDLFDAATSGLLTPFHSLPTSHLEVCLSVS